MNQITLKLESGYGFVNYYFPPKFSLDKKQAGELYQLIEMEVNGIAGLYVNEDGIAIKNEKIEKFLPKDISQRDFIEDLKNKLEKICFVFFKTNDLF